MTPPRPRSHRAALAALALVGASLLACACGSSSLKSAGIACGADTECGAGLSCLALGAFSDAGCTTAARACSRSCTLDADCAPLGAGFKCFAACDGSRSCGATQ